MFGHKPPEDAQVKLKYNCRALLAVHDVGVESVDHVMKAVLI